MNLFVNDKSSSFIPIVESTTNNAMSVLSKTSKDLFILSFPNSPTSSSPAVSIRTQGPIGRISIGLKTGSVVVPAISETIAAF